jgi:CHASE2 domain-containing sensor protein
MVSGLRHGADSPDEELWTIAAWWCGRLGVLVDWQRAPDHSSMLCGILSTTWMDFSWLFIVSYDGCNSDALAQTR